MLRNFIGTSGWCYNHWVGRFYPENLYSYRWLEYYMKKFDTVELNASFYRLPREKTFENWRKRTPENFLFSVKMNRFVTHVKRLLESKNELKNFFSRVSKLEEKCGPILIQLPPSLEFEMSRTEKFLRELEKNYRNYKFTIECRNETWFNKGVYDLFKEYSIALCISDTPNYPYVEKITADFVYVRLHGHEVLYASNYSEEQLQDWASKIRKWNNKDLDVYVYFDNDADAYAVFNALRLKEILNN
ncbi:MAG TPA: DUF72 domain-containing protein [Candidatus Altiarchaeales archaeon]|nr:DUF72 domain-containing protein [Candidatus Altiarchaeales archaeon]